MKLNDEKKSAIKLINQYAERFKRVDQENKDLMNEIEDLKNNLKISKDIIDSFFKSEQKEKSKAFLTKTKEEIKLLNTCIDKLRKNLKESRDQNTYYEIIMNESILKYKDNTEDLNKKIFVLENAIKKKDAIICYLNIKLNSLYESTYLNDDNNEINAKEIYLVEPSTSVMLVYSELAEVKKNYQDTLDQLNSAIERIEQLKVENEKLKKELEEESESDSSKSKGTEIKTHHFNQKSITIDVKEKNFENEEWRMILKKAKISSDTIKNFTNTKIGESVEILVKMIMEKNMQIRVLYNENENLNERNAILNNEICEHKKTITTLKNENKLIKNQQLEHSIILNDNDKQKFEVSLNLERQNQYKNYEKYLDEFNTKTQRINDSIIQDEIKECYKSFITNDSTLIKKKNENTPNRNQMESFISSMRKNEENIFTPSKDVNNI